MNGLNEYNETEDNEIRYTWACMVCGTSNREDRCSRCGCPSVTDGRELASRQKAFEQGIEYVEETAEAPVSPLPQQALPRFWLLRWIVRHWRGGYSLGVSYWLSGLPRMVLIIVLSALIRARPVVVHQLDVSLTVLLECVLLTYVWLGVGIWRSASRHIKETGRRFWARFAQVLVVIGAASTLATFTSNIGTLTQELVLYRKLDHMPKLSVTTGLQGRGLYVDGTLVRGSGDVIAAAIEKNPNLQFVQISGPGGLLDEARIAGKAVKNHHLATFVTSECDSACTLIYMSGSQRVLYRTASLGFHSPVMAPLTVANLYAYAARMRTELIQLGATPNFAALASSIDSQTIWRPDTGTLLANHVVTRLTDVKDWNVVTAN
jgi:hypothetical protein